MKTLVSFFLVFSTCLVLIGKAQSSSKPEFLIDTRVNQYKYIKISTFEEAKIIAKLKKEAYLPDCDRPSDPKPEVLGIIEGSITKPKIREKGYLIRGCDNGSSWGNLIPPFQPVNGWFFKYAENGKFDGKWSDLGQAIFNLKDGTGDGIDDFFSIQDEGPQMGETWIHAYIFYFHTDKKLDIIRPKRLLTIDQIYSNTCNGAYPDNSNQGRVKASVVKLISRNPIQLKLDWYEAKCTNKNPDPPVKAFRFVRSQTLKANMN